MATGHNHEKSETIHGKDVLSVLTMLKTFDFMGINDCWYSNASIDER